VAAVAARTAARAVRDGEACAGLERFAAGRLPHQD